jgi:hypothetical protein
MKVVPCSRCGHESAHVLASEPQGEMFICISCGEAGIIENDGERGDEGSGAAENFD